jgi:hypothetical protein
MEVLMKAFPTPSFSVSEQARVTSIGGEGGMDLRDWFAGLAMQALLEHIDIRHEISQIGVADRAYQMADVMMKAKGS